MRAPTNTPRPRVAASIAVLLVFMAGCHSKTAATPQNFIATLNAHFADHPECLLPDAPRFPYETSDPQKTRQMDALVASKLLDVAREATLHVSRYIPTEMGNRLAPRFCFGHRAVTTIDNFTPPAPANGFTETQVTYHYTMQDVAVWAKSQQMQTAFPALAKALSGDSTDTTTLAGAMTGWQVPD